MRGRTYRYFTGNPLYPFGYGLSYTTFRYRRLHATRIARPDQPVKVSVDVSNAGGRAGDEVVQLYVRRLLVPERHALKELKGFRRIPLKPGESRTVHFTLGADAFATYDEDAGRVMVAPGTYEIQIGASSADIRARTTVEVK